LLQKWEEAYHRLSKPIVVDKERNLLVPDNSNLKLTLTPVDKDAEAALAKLADKKLTVRSLQFLPDEKEGDSTVKIIKIDDVKVKADGSVTSLKEYYEVAKTLEQIDREADTPEVRRAFEKFKTHLVNPRIKLAGRLRIWPWWEERGQNPYLIVSET